MVFLKKVNAVGRNGLGEVKKTRVKCPFLGISTFDWVKTNAFQ